MPLKDLSSKKNQDHRKSQDIAQIIPGGPNPIEKNIPIGIDKVGHRVELKENLKFRGNYGKVVHNGREEKHGKKEMLHDIPQVAEKDVIRGGEIDNPQDEKELHSHDERKSKHSDPQRDPEGQKEHDEYGKGENVIHHSCAYSNHGENLGREDRIFEKSSMVHKAICAHRYTLGEPHHPRKKATEEKSGKLGDADAQKIRENKGVNQGHDKRVKKGPEEP